MGSAGSDKELAYHNVLRTASKTVKGRASEQSGFPWSLPVLTVCRQATRPSQGAFTPVSRKRSLKYKKRRSVIWEAWGHRSSRNVCVPPGSTCRYTSETLITISQPWPLPAQGQRRPQGAEGDTGEWCILWAGLQQQGGSSHLPAPMWKREVDADVPAGRHPCGQRPRELCSQGAHRAGCWGSREGAAWCQFACWGVQPLQWRHRAEHCCSPWLPPRQGLGEGSGNIAGPGKVSGGGEQQD